MKIQDNWIHNAQELYLPEVLWMEREQRTGRHFLNPPFHRTSIYTSGLKHLVLQIQHGFFSCGISTQTWQHWPWRSKGRTQSNPKPWLGLGSLRCLVGWRMPTGWGKFLESDPCSNQCSQLVLALFWRWSCCHNHSGHCFRRARDCSLLEMGGWNCLNSHLGETESKNSSQEQPGNTITAPALCSGEVPASAANKNSVIGTRPSTKNTARTESLIRRSFHPLPTWDCDRRFSD